MAGGKPLHSVLKVTQCGNSLGTVLPREILAELDLDRGDKLFLTRSPDGNRVTKSDPDFVRRMTLARDIMKKRHIVLRELARWRHSRLAFRPNDREVILAVHKEQLARHGGGVGVRDEGLLDPALARPIDRPAYDPDADCASLAADYALRLATNRPFVDGNERTSFVAMVQCLALNGFQLIAGDEEA